jgi:hypothetical protein
VATMSNEKKMSNAMQTGMGNLDFDPALVALDYMQRNSNMQNRMMDLILTFLGRWATDYTSGSTTEGEIMHKLGETSHIMLSALTATQGGRHSE